MIKDRLWIDGVEIELSDNTDIVLNRSVGDIGDMSAILSGYSNTIRVKKTANNLQAFGYSSFANVDTQYPHIEHKATLMRNGITLFTDGIATVKASDEEIEILLQWGVNESIRELKNTKMNELPITDTTLWEEYTLAHENDLSDWIRWSDITNAENFAVEHMHTMRPAVKVSKLFYMLIPNLELNSNYQSFIDKLWMLLPTSNGSREVVEKLWWKIQSSFNYQDSLPSNPGNDSGVDLVKKVSSAGYALMTDGSYEETVSHVHGYYNYMQIPISGTYRVTGTISLGGSGTYTLYLMTKRTWDTSNNAIPVREIVPGAGQEDGKGIPSSGGTINVNVDISLGAGEVLFIELVSGSSGTRSVSVNLDFRYVVNNANDYKNTGYLMDYPIKENLPNISCLDFIKGILGMFGGMVEPEGESLRVFTFDEVIQAKDQALDLTQYMVNNKTNNRVEYSFGLTKDNLLTYADDKLVPEGYGDYTFSADTYDNSENVVVELPFAASEERVPMYTFDWAKSEKLPYTNNILLGTSFAGYNVDISNNPRILLDAGTHQQAFWIKSGTRRRPPSYVAWNSIVTNTYTVKSFTFNGLSFSNLSGLYWQGYMGIFSKKPRIVKRDILLTDEIVQQIKFRIPVYVEGNYYAVLSIDNYFGNGLAEITLAMIDGVEIQTIPANVLKADTFTPLMFDFGEYALYTKELTAGQQASDITLMGKLIRELDDIPTTYDPNTTYAAVDDGEGEAKKIPLSKLGSYWELIAQNATESYLSSKYSAKIDKQDGWFGIGTKRLTEISASSILKLTNEDLSFAHFHASGDVVAYSTGAATPLPIATGDTLGMVKVGSGLSILPDGTLSSTGGGISTVLVTGTGNAVTGGSVDSSGKTLTLTRGSNFALQTSLDTTNSNLASHAGNTTIHITASERSNWNTAYNQAHTHSNKSYLDIINQGLGTSYSPTFNNLYTTNHVYASGDVIAYSTGTAAALPIASATTLGMIKVGSGLVINNGVLSTTSSPTDIYLTSVTGSGNGTVTFARNGATALTWSSVHSHSDYLSGVTTSGTGNVVTGISKSGQNVVATMGTVSGGDWSGGTITNTITKNTGSRFLYSSNGITNGFALDLTTVDVQFYSGLSGTLDTHFQFYRGATKLAQLGATYCSVVVNWTVTSDMRRKNRLYDFTEVLDRIKKLEVFAYTRKDLENSPTFIGSSAQQMKEIFPEFHSYDYRSDTHGITYDQAGYSIAVAGLKEVLTRLEKLEAKMSA